jgi:haloacetate dehalogenase
VRRLPHPSVDEWTVGYRQRVRGLLATLGDVFEGFDELMVEAAGLRLLARQGGAGPAVLLLHGHPRTSSTWHRVAPLLVDRGRTVVCVDLPGYGRSDKPAPTADHRPHAKRAGARHLLAAMNSLGHHQFDLVGHDRGSYYGLRLALDHPKVVRKLALLDSLPISEHIDRADARFATAWWHWFFFAQPEIPERVITADPDAWYCGDPAAMGEANHAEWLTAMRDPEVVRGMLEDYRAGLTVDYADEAADRAAGRRVTQPLLVLWSTLDDLDELYGDPLDIWSSWADDVTGHGIHSPHHMAEQAPDDLVTALDAFLGKDVPERVAQADLHDR